MLKSGGWAHCSPSAALRPALRRPQLGQAGADVRLQRVELLVGEVAQRGRGLCTPALNDAPQLGLRPAAVADDQALLAAFLGEALPAHQDAEVTHWPGVAVTSNDNSNGRSQISVGAGNGGGVEVNVTQIAGAGRPRPRGKGINVKARRLNALYRKAGAEGVSFRKVYEEHGGNRNVVFAAWQAGRAAGER
jgi:hypothetical protein